ncbi:integrase core domain-containing protein [Pseudomonas panipatensis]|uniref:Integrase core domain-containing protein n=1 Tax=Pseudomonas panipatensis TaxID=428992 RepID=A0A1G8MXW6_9PSED|nr:Integrase core domain-containing protein [Pseudomonas panipatensis]SMP78666.1 Integrase core domain-containing protein [Pseudomonas panipatensis]
MASWNRAIAPAIKQLCATVKSALDRWRVLNASQLQKSLDRFSVRYNAERPHLNLGGRTPLKA